ncbi:Gfo/Idh/MocA family oxidoreductase [Candidatus Woesearchaeota archaeon]|nr:Gfo/Idh/MocA family oxidoreductase [Candidatus Woesearchaeota archaeon]
MDKLKVAVIGVGSMGKSHARVYCTLKNVELAAVCDSNEETARGIAEKYGIRHYTDYNEMLKKENLSAVSICVPTKFHKKVAIDCIRKKLNALVEKPIAATVEEAKEIISEANKNNVKLMVGHIERFNPVVMELKRKIGNGELGKIYKVHCARLSPFPQRVVDVGVIVDLAIHEIDILKHIIGSRIKRIYAETAQRIHSAHEDLLIGTLRFENDILGVINANWLTPKKVREITVTGEKGMLVANYLTQEFYFYENEFAKKPDYNSNFMNVLEGKKIQVKIRQEEPLKNELEAFIESILKNKSVPVTGKDGLDALNIAQKFIESSKKNKVIAL